MPTHLLLLLSITLLSYGCSGDKHLPSSNPPEYDPKKVYTAPVAPSSTPSTSSKPTQSIELEGLKAQLESLETDPKAKGEGKKIPFDPNLFPRFKGVTNPCEALSRLAPALSSEHIFESSDGAALKRALGPDADGIARRMDEYMAEGLKHSLGPGAANCPISVRPQKRSALFQPARLVLAHSTPSQSLLLAQTTIPDTSQNDYEVEKHSSRDNPPPGWVGWKTTDTMTRIGKKPATEGIRELYEMIIAPRAMKCPGPDGVVAGEFHWSFELMRSTTGAEGMHGVLYKRAINATLKGQVDDDARVQHVDFDATISFQHIGTEVPYSSHIFTVHARFTIDQRLLGIPNDLSNITVSDFSVGEAEAKDAQLVGNLTILTAYFSGQEYFAAQMGWNKPNTCVELIFTPATRTKKLSPNESVSVKTELRTKREQVVVPAKYKQVTERPRDGNGTVSPKQTESATGSPASFTYTMPEKRVKHSGFWVSAVSRAGVAQALDGEWEVADGGMKLQITNRIWADPESSHAKIGYAQFDGTVQFDIPLEQVAEGWFRGEINVVRPLVVRHVRPAANPCAGSGSQTEHWTLSAQINPKAESMVIHLGFTASNEQAAWTCSGPAGTWTKELTVNVHSQLHSLQMPTKTGVKKGLTGRDAKYLEWLSVAVLKGAD